MVNVISYERVPSTWPDGYFPLWRRAVDDAGRALKAGTLTITPATGLLDYFTHEPLPNELVPVDRRTGMIRLLAQPGEYTITGTTAAGRIHTITIKVINPITTAVAKPFRDGELLLRRPGKSDQFIIDENPYRELPVHGVVLDCGAHIGTFTRDALARGAECVYAYEPEPINFFLLRLNTIDLPVSCHNAAIDAVAAEARLFYLSWTDEGRGSSGNTLYGRYATKPVISVRVESIANALHVLRPHTVKLDIKFAEREIDWDTIPWPSETRAVALEVDHRTDMVTLTAAMGNHGFAQLPTKRAIWRRPVTIWTR